MNLTFEKILAEAGKGDIDSQYELASMYKSGTGVPKDLSEALKWFEKAANKNHTEANIAIGDLLVKEKRIKLAEHNISLKYYYENFDPEAFVESDYVTLNRYGLDVYKHFEGYKELDEESAEFIALIRIDRAARFGSLEAQIYLSEIYYYHDNEESYRLTKLASKQGDANSQNLLGWIYAKGYTYMGSDYKKALKCFSKAAEKDNTCAQFYLGWMYDNGVGVPKNYKEAAKWYRKAAEQSHSIVSEYELFYKIGFRSEMYDINIHKAQYHLGLMYENGKGVLKDHKEAVKWYKKASELLDGETIENWYIKAEYEYDVKAEYEYDEYLFKDPDFWEDASEWRIKFEPEDHLFPSGHIFDTLASTFHNLGMKYYLGEGVLKDYEKAENYFLKSYQMGDVHSAYMLHIIDSGEDYWGDDTRMFSYLEMSAGADIFSPAFGFMDQSKHFDLNDIEFYKKAVRKGYAKSQYLLGTIYTETEIIRGHIAGGPLREISEATKWSISKYWIKKAYENSDKGVIKKADDFWNKHELWKYEDHIGPNNEPTDDEKIKNIISIDNKSEESSLTGIFGGSAFISIGRRFINGDGILKDPIKAIKYYKKAIEHSNIKEDQRDLMDAKAKFELGVIYHEENSVKNYTESKYWINKAYESTDAIINKKAEDFWNKNKLWNY